MKQKPRLSVSKFTIIATISTFCLFSGCNCDNLSKFDRASRILLIQFNQGGFIKQLANETDQEFQVRLQSELAHWDGPNGYILWDDWVARMRQEASRFSNQRSYELATVERLIKANRESLARNRIHAESPNSGSIVDEMLSPVYLDGMNRAESNLRVLNAIRQRLLAQ